MEEEAKKAEEKMADAPAAAQPAGGSGMEPTLAATLAWAFGIVSGIIFIVIEKEDKYVKFWAYQAVLLTLVLIVGSVIAGVLTVVLIGLLLYPILYIGGLILWVMGLIKAYQGEKWMMPVIGKIADDMASK